MKLIRFIAIGFLFTFLISNSAYAQKSLDTVKKETTWSMLKTDTNLIWGGVKNAYTRPLHWKKDDWLTFGGIAAGTALMYLADEETSEFFMNQEENAPHLLKEVGWYYGSPQNFFMISTGIYGYGLFAKNEKFRHTGVLIITSAVATGFIQTISKNAFGRARPTENVGSSEFKFLSKEPGYHSFPSGHSILSFTASHAIAKQFKNIWVKGGIYAVGLIAPVSRLWAGAHWLTDVTLGMVISVVIVDGVDKFLTKKKNENFQKNKKISWKVKAGVKTIGLVGVF
ncbi:phosphatase PAP2 family protein [Lutibacter citreus]|uniref:phosphatase PAP2 family protein n=1 Tax=Lutibacter citreus TaxID=2138210 RepID=UPI000DBE1983|nr:phosphatase PAP2 family protein [Lutibacter citreus]